jgi:hypothetical protein
MRKKESPARVRAQRQREERQPLPVWPEKVVGGPLVEELNRHVRNLRSEEEHGNRRLFLDDVFVAYLLAFFNPSIRSLRTIQDFSQTVQAQRHLTTRKICKTSLSDFNQLADPERLQPLVRELRAAVSRKFGPHPPADLRDVLQQVIAVDGTFFAGAADIAWSIAHRNQHEGRRSARVDVHLDVHTWLPEVIAVPEPGEGEAARAARAVKPGAIHVYDRGFASFELIAAHYERGALSEERWQPRAEFVLRTRLEQCLLKDVTEQPLTAAQQSGGIVADRLGMLQGSAGHRSPPPVQLREIILLAPDGSELRLLTNLLELPAEVVAEIYRSRWQIELFFRWLKCYANFDHLISHSRQGVLLNFYVVIIGVLLMYLHTGGRPSKYALALLSTVAQGGGSLMAILPILRARERECELARQSAARRRARKKAAAQ